MAKRTQWTQWTQWTLAGGELNSVMDCESSKLVATRNDYHVDHQVVESEQEERRLRQR